jgi:heme-degrading monooxygenase HmoA
MIRTLLFLRPVLRLVSGEDNSIEQFFEQEQVLQRAAEAPGFISAELLRPTDGSGVMLVTALWESQQAYQAWVEDPWRATNSERAARVFEAVEVEGGGGSRYETVVTVTS